MHYEEFPVEHPIYAGQTQVMIRDHNNVLVEKTRVPLASIDLGSVTRIRLETYDDLIDLYLGDIARYNLDKLYNKYKRYLFNTRLLILTFEDDTELMYSVHWNEMSREDFFDEVVEDVPIGVRMHMYQPFFVRDTEMCFGYNYLNIFNEHEGETQGWFYTKENMQNVANVIKSYYIGV